MMEKVLGGTTLVCGFERVDRGDVVLKLEIELIDQFIGCLASVGTAHLAEDGFDHRSRVRSELLDRRLDTLSGCVKAHMRITRASVGQSQAWLAISTAGVRPLPWQ